ncbi:Gfo/Idh/MocA family oxidoreductase [Myxococcota bacterium]
MTVTNVGFIGCGRIADLHAVGYQDRVDARLHTVCDTDEATARRRLEEWNAVRWTTDYRELLRDPDLHAVEVLTPQLLHEPMVIEALQAGKHVAVQKPMTVDLPSADRMVAAAQEAGRVFKITENYVFYPPIVLAKQLIDDGAIGPPHTLRLKMLGGSKGGWEVPASAWEWRIQEAAAGRPFATFDHGHHIWSTAWFLLGEVERVAAWIDSYDGVVDSPAVMMWKHRDAKRYGTCDFVHAGELRVPSKYYSNDEWIEITGERGLIHIHRCTGNVHEGPPVSLYDGETWRTFDDTDVDADWAAGFVGATHNFIDSIEGLTSPLLDGAQGREILRFDLAVQRAARLRREVYLDELDHPVPTWYSLQRRARELIVDQGISLLSRLGVGTDTSKYASRAIALTGDLARRYDPTAAATVETVIGLHLTEDNGVEERFALRIADGSVHLEAGSLPDDSRLTVWMPAGLWAAILLGKQRVETALFQGKIKFEGQAEEALKLRDVFGL